MALPDWVIIGGIVTAITGPIIQALRVRPESKKMRQDGTANMLTGAGAMLQSVHEEMADLRIEVRELRQWRTRLERLGRAHSKWDDHVVGKLAAAGITVPEPPPLFDSSDGG